MYHHLWKPRYEIDMTCVYIYIVAWHLATTSLFVVLQKMNCGVWCPHILLSRSWGWIFVVSVQELASFSNRQALEISSSLAFTRHSEVDVWRQIWLVVSSPLKNISQIGSLSQLLDTIGENQKCSKPPTRNTLCNRHRAPPTCPWRRHVPSSHPPAIAAAPPRDDAGNSPGQSPADTCDPNGHGALKPAEPVAVAT